VKILRAYDVMDQHLLRRRPDHSGDSVDSEQHARVPHLDCIGVKEHGPRRRHAHEEDLSNLDELSTVMAIGEAAEIHRKEEKRRPVADIRKSRESGRTKLLKQKPVAHNVLDVVRHHRQHRADEVNAEVPVMQGRKGRLSV